MNRLIRIILYITAGCVGIGCAALILSFALGGGRMAWEEDSMFGWTKGAARDIVENAKEQVYQKVNDADYDDYDNDDESYGDIGLLTVDASSIDDLSIDLQHGYLSVEESDDNRIRVSITESFDGITAECESGEIIIKDSRTGKRGREDAYVFLEIPDSMQFQNVHIQINAGVMHTNCSFLADHLTVNAGAGEISLCEVTSDVLSASVGAGTMDIEDSRFETVSLDCGVGTMDIEADITGDAEIKCGMGAVDLELAEGTDSVNYALHCGAGSIEIGDSTYSGVSKKSRIENGASSTFTLDCGMGQICID